MVSFCGGILCGSDAGVKTCGDKGSDKVLSGEAVSALSSTCSGEDTETGLSCEPSPVAPFGTLVLKVVLAEDLVALFRGGLDPFETLGLDSAPSADTSPEGELS